MELIILGGSKSLWPDIQMATLIYYPYDFSIIPTFKSILSKFHKIVFIITQVTELQVTLLLCFHKIMDSKQFRVLIYHCFLIGKNTVTAREWLQKCYKESAPPKSIVKYWFAEFRHGRVDTDDAERSGRPNEAVTAENVDKVEKMIISKRKVKLQA